MTLNVAWSHFYVVDRLIDFFLLSDLLIIYIDLRSYGQLLFLFLGYAHNPYNGVMCNDTITATGVFSAQELWKFSKGKGIIFRLLFKVKLYTFFMALILFLYLYQLLCAFITFYFKILRLHCERNLNPATSNLIWNNLSWG